MQKRIISIIAVALTTFLMISCASTGVKDGIEKIRIKTSTVQCDMCKETIETALNATNGVVSSDVDMKRKYTTVEYDSKLITPDTIRMVISKAGYQADDLAADKSVYVKLPACCKLPEDR